MYGMIYGSLLDSLGPRFYQFIPLQYNTLSQAIKHCGIKTHNVYFNTCTATKSAIWPAAEEYKDKHFCSATRWSICVLNTGN